MKYGETVFDIAYLLFASVLPLLGMLMIPKTICYMLILGIFIKEARSCNRILND